MTRLETEEFVVEYSESQETKDVLFDRVISFFVKHTAFFGESICQNDKPQMEAPELLADIADHVIKFHVSWKD